MNARRLRGSRGENGRDSATSLSAAEIHTTVRRLGFVTLKVHEIIMARLLKEDQALAERFNDVFKPLVDLMLHFNLEDDDNGEA